MDIRIITTLLISAATIGCETAEIDFRENGTGTTVQPQPLTTDWTETVDPLTSTGSTGAQECPVPLCPGPIIRLDGADLGIWAKVASACSDADQPVLAIEMSVVAPQVPLGPWTMSYAWTAEVHEPLVDCYRDALMELGGVLVP